MESAKITINDFRASIGVSYEAVRKKLEKDPDFYEKHITKAKINGRMTKCLDEEAVARLTSEFASHIKSSSEVENTAIARAQAETREVQESAVAKFQELQAIIDAKTEELVKLQELRIQEQERHSTEINRLNERRITDQQERERDLAEKDQQIKELEVGKARLEEQKSAADERIRQLESLLEEEKNRSIWSRLFKKQKKTDK